MDTTSLVYYFGVLAILVAAIWILVFFIKKFTQNKVRVSAKSNDIFNSKTSSLFVQEVLPIDQKTKIIIVGRDNLRHVILLGETHSNLIETVTPNSLLNTDPSTAFRAEVEAANTAVTATKLAFKPATDAQINGADTPTFESDKPTPSFNSFNSDSGSVPDKPRAEKSPKSEPALTTNIAGSVMNQPSTASAFIKPKAPTKPQTVAKADIKVKPKADVTATSEPKANASNRKVEVNRAEAKKPTPETANAKPEINKSDTTNVDLSTIETNKKGIVSKLQDAKNLSDTAKD